MAIVNAHVAAVQELYVAYFNRPADYAGLDYWTNVVAANNGDTTAISAAFAAEAEYKTEYADMTDAEIVDQVYQNLFGRPAEAAGKTYWADLLTAGSITIDKVVAEIANGALTTDAEAYENKVAGATAFTAALDTAAEQNGYRGAEANAEAKEFISSITTDASLTAATAPAALAATVAGVVAAGTPFTLVSGLATLEAANTAVADFLAEVDLDGDGEADEDVVAGDVTAAATTAQGDVAALITVGTADPADAPANYLAASATVQAALLQDQIKANAEALETAQAAQEDDEEAIAEVDGLTSAIAALESADEALEVATDAAAEATIEQNAAEASFEARNATLGNIAITAEGTVTLVGADGIAGNADDIELIVADGDELVLGDDIDADDYAGVATLIAAINANQAAAGDLALAERAQLAAQLEVNLLDVGAGESDELNTLVGLLDTTAVGTIEDGMPTVDQILTQRDILVETNGDVAGFDTALNGYLAANTGADAATGNPLTDALLNETTGSKVAADEAAEAIEDLAEAVAALDTANANVEQLEALQAVVTAATDAFGDNDFRTPVSLDATEVATANSDIYVVGDFADFPASTISSFGRVGNDALFIGTEFTLNTGDLDEGNNSALEVFFVQDGTSVKIHLETEVYGSDSGVVGEQIITLTGVDADNLVLANGIITLKGEGA